MSGAELQGVDQMLANIRHELSSGVERVENQGLKLGGEIFAEAQRQKVAVSGIEHVHIKDSIGVSNVRRGDGSRFVLIGASKEVAWRVHFTENGTKRSPAQPFIYPAFHENKARVSRVIAAVFRGGMR